MFQDWCLTELPPNIGPNVWFRYVDDVVEAIHKDIVDEVTAHLSNCNPSIQITVELQLS